LRNKNSKISHFYHNNESSENNIEYQNSATLNQINDVIFSLERNIAEMNRNYKNLLIKINVSASLEEQQNLKRNANIIANNLSEQSEKLVSLKTRQQELLKNSLNL
jgi:ribosomal protein S3